MLFRKRRERMGAATKVAALTGVEALDQRLPVAEGGRALLRKAFPDHWSFLLGELALYSFVVLVLTGTYLTFFFDPSMSESVYQGSYVPLRGQLMTQAYATTLDISFDVRGGLLIRQIHHWAALMFLSAISLHMLRIFFTGAFRRPREVNWTVGLSLFILGLLEGFCGYSLPDDLLSGTGLRTAHTIVLSLPIVGTYLAFFLWGGSYPGEAIIPRLYALHILLVPGILIGLITLHLILVVYLKHTQWGGRGRTNRNAVGQPMFPQFTAKTGGLFMMVFGLLAGLSALAQINPVWNYGPYRPDVDATGSQPDWYVGFLEGALRIMPPWENNVAGHTFMWNVLIPAVILPGALFTALFVYPFFEKWVTGDTKEHHLCDRPRDRPTRTGLGVAGIVFYSVLLLSGGNDVTAFSFRVSVNGLTWVLRIAVIAGPLLAFFVTKRLCLALQAHERELLTEGEETGEVSQSLYGGISESHRPLPVGRRYRILARDIPRPLKAVDGTASRRDRVRATLSRWYYQDRVEMPTTPEQRRRIEEILAEPGEQAAREEPARD